MLDVVSSAALITLKKRTNVRYISAPHYLMSWEMCNNSNKEHLGAANEPPVIDIIQPYLDVIYISMKAIKEFVVNNFSLNYC